MISCDQAGQSLRSIKWIWAAACVLASLLFVRDFMLWENGTILNQVVWGRDFINVWTGGTLLNAGQGQLLFDLPAYGTFQRSLFGMLTAHNYSYPPVSYPIAQFLAGFSYPVALALWFAATGVLFFYAARPWWPKNAGPAWLALLTPAALLNVWAGHYGFLVGALFLLGWRRVDDHPIQSGVFFGLMLIKPHLAILVPLALILRKKWMVVASATATVAMLVAITTLTYGWASWGGYLFQTSAVQAAMIDAGTAFYGALSTSAVTGILRLTGSWPTAIVMQGATATTAVVMLVLAARRSVPTAQLGLMTATATFLVLPYAFVYDLTAVAIAAVVTIAAARGDHQKQRWALYGLIAPAVGVLFALLSVPLLPVLLVALFMAQAKMIFAGYPVAHSDPQAAPALA